jgi:SAM-dependent methyltransferase
MIKDDSLRGRQIPTGAVNFGDLRRTVPISSLWGFDRGQPIDRYYIEAFLQQREADIRGRVLEVGDPAYTRQFGGDRVTASDVLNLTAIPGTTVQADIACAPQIPSEIFDCIIFTQTLQLIYDLRAAAATLHRILRPEGVLLATFPGITHTGDGQWGRHWCWSLTRVSAARLFGEVFDPADVTVSGRGNVLTAIAFLHGIAAEERQPHELDDDNQPFDVTIAVRAVRRT